MKETLQADVKKGIREQRTVFAQGAITILRSVSDIYHFWNNPENFMSFFSQIESVNKTSDSEFVWMWRPVKNGNVFELKNYLVEREPERFLSWITTYNNDIKVLVRVHLQEQPYRRGTVVQVKLSSDRPLATNLFKTIVGESPEKYLKLFLTQLRQYLESGEVATVEGQPAGDQRKHEKKSALH